MNINTEAIDEAALALLYLTLHDQYRAWKGLDWDVSIAFTKRASSVDPVNKTKRFQRLPSCGATRCAHSRSDSARAWTGGESHDVVAHP